MENMDGDTLEYFLHEIPMADKSEAYAGVYREIFGIIEENYCASQAYAEEMRDYKQERWS